MSSYLYKKPLIKNRKCIMEDVKELRDEEVIGRVLSGDKTFYEIIVRRFNPYLYKVGRSYSYSHEDTEDLMQDTFVDAYKSLSKFEGRSSFKTWIVRIMLNNCYHKSQKSSFKKEAYVDVQENAKPMFNSSENETTQTIRSHELQHIIEEALGRIPLNYRMVFSLREINGFNVRDTAELLHISENNVKVRLNRSKKMLKNELGRSYAPSELFDFNLIYCDAIVENVMERINKL